MEIRKSLHANGWQLAAAAMAVAAFAAFATMDDAGPLDVKPFADGLQVSLRAVADGNDRPAVSRMAEGDPTAAANRLQPVVAQPAFAAKAR
jgi:hypothetical protein